MDHLLATNRGPMAWALSAAGAHPNPPIEFRGMTDAGFRILRYEGIGALYSGLAPTLWMSVPATVLYFTCNDKLRQSLNNRLCLHGPASGATACLISPLIAGCTARVLAQSVVSPLELIRT